MPKWFFVYVVVVVVGTVATSPLLWAEMLIALMVTSLSFILPVYLYLIFTKQQ